MRAIIDRPQIRQGDVLLIPTDAPKNPTRANDDSGQPLAGLRIEGERTGHSHELSARVYDTNVGRFLFLERPTNLTHQEHKHIEVPAGWWRVVTQREYEPARRLTRSRWD